MYGNIPPGYAATPGFAEPRRPIDWDVHSLLFSHLMPWTGVSSGEEMMFGETLLCSLHVLRGDGDRRGPVCACRELEKAAEMCCDPQGLMLVELNIQGKSGDFSLLH